MDVAWADTVVDTLVVHERIAQVHTRDAYDYLTLLVLAANAVLLFLTVRAARDSARATRDAAEATKKATQTDILNSLLQRLFSRQMVDAVALIEKNREHHDMMNGDDLQHLEKAQTMFLSYGWLVGSLFEDDFIDEKTTKVAMPIGWAEDYQKEFRGDPLAETFLRLHDLPIPPKGEE
jgi:hypothetical protein